MTGKRVNHRTIEGTVGDHIIRIEETQHLKNDKVISTFIVNVEIDGEDYAKILEG